jgi:hypothetical protein
MFLLQIADHTRIVAAFQCVIFIDQTKFDEVNIAFGFSIPNNTRDGSASKLGEAAARLGGALVHAHDTPPEPIRGTSLVERRAAAVSHASIVSSL